MNRALRQRHFRLITALALVAAGLLILAMRGREPIPGSVLPPAELLP